MNMTPFACAALMSMTSPAAFAAEEYVFDDAHTSVLLFVNHLGFSDVQGEFHDITGALTLDRKRIERSRS